MGQTVATGPSGVGEYLRELFSLEGRRALVTGGSSGIGAAAARALGAAGADVVVGGRDGARAAAVAETIVAAGGTASVELGDLSDPDHVEAFAGRVLERHGTVDVLVNCAGVFHRSAAEATPRGMWDESLAVNVTAMFVLCQSV